MKFQVKDPKKTHFLTDTFPDFTYVLPDIPILATWSIPMEDQTLQIKTC